jgi:N4-gp56 family major capsid protein
MSDVIFETGSSNVDKTLTELVRKQLEMELRSTLPHLQSANRFITANFVAGTNNTLRFLRVADLDVKGTTALALAEGVTPDSEDLSFGYEEMSATQVGRLIKLTDLLMERVDAGGGALAIAAEKIARNAAQEADVSVAETLAAGTNAIFAGTGNSAVNQVGDSDIISVSLLRRAVQTLKADNVPAFADGYFHAIIHPDVVFDLMEEGADGQTVGTWIDASRYAGSMPLLAGELGRLAGVRFIESSAAKVYDGSGQSSENVYNTCIFGPEAFAFGDWGTTKSYYTAPGGQGDQLHQKAAIGWKGNYGSILVEEAGARYINLLSASSI